MESVLGVGLVAVFFLMPILFVVMVAVMAIPLFFTTKMFGVQDSSFWKSVKVNLMVLGLSFVAGIGLGMMGLIIPIIPHLLSFILPFAIYVFLVQKEYELNLVESCIVTGVQYVVGILLVVAMVFGLLIPLGIGAAVLGS